MELILDSERHRFGVLTHNMSLGPLCSRMYNYYLGGKDHYLVDRSAANEVLRAAPQV